jgi:hypothetical protein
MPVPVNADGACACEGAPRGYDAPMTTTPFEPQPDPEVVPSGDPAAPPTQPNPVAPGESPGDTPGDDDPDRWPRADPVRVLRRLGELEQQRNPGGYVIG